MGRISLTGVKPSELRALYRDLQKQGVGLSMTGKTHVRLEFPNGRTMTGPLTSGNRHAAKQLVGRIRKHADWNVMSDPRRNVGVRKEGNG